VTQLCDECDPNAGLKVNSWRVLKLNRLEEMKMTATILSTNILNRLAEELRIVCDGRMDPKAGERIGVRLESVNGLLSAADVRDVELEPDLLKLGPTSITGKLPMMLQVPVRIDVEWKVFKLVRVATKFGDVFSRGEELKRGKDFESFPAGAELGNSIRGPEVLFLFHPKVIEPTEDQILPRPIPALICAKVTLSAQKANSETEEVKFPDQNQPPLELELPILLPVIPLPTVLALFRHPNFLPRDTNLSSRPNFVDTPDGFVLLVVPENSPVKAVTHLFDVLNTIESLGSLVGSLVPAQARLLLGLQKLASAIGAQPHIKFRAVNQLDNLNAVVMIQRDAVHNDIEVEDEVSSLILLGPKGTKVSLYNNRDLVSGDGVLEIETGSAGLVVIRDLHTAGDPVSETGGTINRRPASKKPDGFGDAISSLRFAPQVRLPPVGPLSSGGANPLKTAVAVGT
jgi:hypothetical protein